MYKFLGFIKLQISPKSMNFLRRLNCGNFIFYAPVLKLGGLLGRRKLTTNAKFQLNIFKITLDIGKTKIQVHGV